MKKYVEFRGTNILDEDIIIQRRLISEKELINHYELLKSEVAVRDLKGSYHIHICNHHKDVMKNRPCDLKKLEVTKDGIRY